MIARSVDPWTRSLALALATAVACAPVSERVVAHDRLLRTETPVGPPVERKTAAHVDVQADAVKVTLETRGLCPRSHVRVVHRTHAIDRRVNGLVQFLEYTTGFLALGAGTAGYLLADRISTGAGDPGMPAGPVTPGEARTAGMAVGGVGALFLLLGVVDSFRALDRRVDVGEVRLPDGDKPELIACDTRPLADTDVGLVATNPGTLAASYIPVGRTDAAGTAQLAWPVVPEDVVEGKDWPKTAVVVTGDPAEIRREMLSGRGIGHRVIGEASLAFARGALGERAWLDTEKAATVGAYRAYAERFPEQHSSEAAAKYKKLRVAEIDAAMVAAAARSEFDRARALFAEWSQFDPTSPALAKWQGAIADLERLAGVAQVVEASLANAEKNPDGELSALARAQAALVEVQQRSPEDARLASWQARLARLKTERSVKLREAADRAVKDKDYEKALGLLAEAVKLTPDELAIAYALRAARGAEARRLLAEVAESSRKKDFGVAEELLRRVEQLLPGDKAAAKARRALEKRRGGE